MMNAMFMLLNSIEARSRFGRTLESLRQDSSKEVEFSHEHFPFHLDDDDSIRLGEAVQHSTHLQKLHLDVTAMTTAGTRTLLPAIATLPRLATLRMEGDTSTRTAKRLTATITNQLITAARQNPHLQSLQLSGTHFHSPTVADACAHLTELMLCDVWHDATPAMVQRLARGLRESHTLRTLTLVSVRDAVAAPLLEDGARHMRQLTTLHVSVPRLSVVVAKAIRSVLDTSAVQRLHLWGLRDLDAPNWGPVVQGLVQSTTAHDVVLGACAFTDAAMHLLCTELLRNSNAALHSLNVTQSIRKIDHWKAICTALHRNTTLHILDMCNNPHVPYLPAAKALDDLLCRNKHLHQLDIDRNPCMQIAPRSLRTNQSLCHLDVSGTELGDAGFARLCTMFDTNTTLRRLYVCGNELTTLEPLATALRNNPHIALTHFYAHGNAVGDDGAMQMAQSIRPGSSLRTLYLDHVRMGAAGAAALLAHPSLTSLSLGELDLRGDTASAMEKALANMSPQLQQLSMSIDSGPGGAESDEEDNGDDVDDDEEDSSADTQPRTTTPSTSCTHHRTQVLNKMLLERGLHLEFLSLNSHWFRLDPQVVQFVLERNKSRDAVTATRNLLPHALSQVHLPAAFWLLRRDPAAWSSTAAATSNRHATTTTAKSTTSTRASTAANERLSSPRERRARKRQKTTP